MKLIILAITLTILLSGISSFSTKRSSAPLVFTHAPNGDFGRSHTDNFANYLTWGNGKWAVRLENGQFSVSPC